MPRPAVRFLHASGLRIDWPADELAEAPAPFRELLASAGVVALQRLVAAAQQRDVDFVLLGGDSFCEADRSVAARAALRQAFERLADASIPVFVVPGRLDPAAAWLAFPSLPENVTLLTPDPSGDGPHIIERDDAEIAAIEYWHQPLRTLRRPHSTSSEWRIAVLAESPWGSEEPPEAGNPPITEEFRRLADAGPELATVAVVAPRRTETVGRTTVHAPGAAVAGPRGECGPWGASFVTLPAEGAPSCEFLPLSPISIVEKELTIDRSTSEEEIVEELQRTLRAQDGVAGQQLLICRWTLRGRGPWLRSLQDPDYRQLLMDQVLDGVGRVEWRVLPSFRVVAVQDKSLPRDRQAPPSLLSQAQSALDEQAEEIGDLRVLQEEFAERRWLVGTHTRWPDAGAVLAGAGRQLAEWLTSNAVDRENAQ